MRERARRPSGIAPIPQLHYTTLDTSQKAAVGWRGRAFPLHHSSDWYCLFLHLGTLKSQPPQVQLESQNLVAVNGSAGLEVVLTAGQARSDTQPDTRDSHATEVQQGSAVEYDTRFSTVQYKRDKKPI